MKKKIQGLRIAKARVRVFEGYLLRCVVSRGRGLGLGSGGGGGVVFLWKTREKGKGVGRVGSGVGKSMRTRLSKLPFSSPRKIPPKKLIWVPFFWHNFQEMRHTTLFLGPPK